MKHHGRVLTSSYSDRIIFKMQFRVLPIMKYLGLVFKCPPGQQGLETFYEFALNENQASSTPIQKPGLREW